MKILAIDSSGGVASAAVLEDGILRSSFTTDGQKKHSTTLLPMIRETLEIIDMPVSEIDAVAVAAGPGSFTGLRIGSATAKGLGLALSVPVIPVPTLMALAYNLYGTDALICPVMDARRDQVYNGLYRFEEGEILALTEQRAVYMDDLIDELNERLRDGGRVMFLGDGVPVFRGRIEERMKVPFDFAPPGLSRQRAASVAVLGKILFDRGEYGDADEHRPFYLRKSQAEQEKERQEKEKLH